MVFILLILSAFLAIQPLYAQPAISTYYYDANELYGEIFDDIFPLDRGGFVASGKSTVQGWIMVVNQEGARVWDLLIDLWAAEFLSVIECDNGDILSGGFVNYGPGSFAAIRLNAEGEQQWIHSYRPGMCFAVIELKDGRCALAGKTNNSSYITLIEGNGEPVWESDFDVNAHLFGLYAIRETDNGIIAAGRYQEGQRTMPLGRVLKVSFEGELLWSYDYTISENRGSSNYITSMVSAGDGGYMIGGWGLISDHDGSSNPSFLLKIDRDGEEEFLRTYHMNQAGSRRVQGLARMTDGTFLIAGYMSVAGPRSYPFVDRVEADGDLISQVDSSDIYPPGDMVARYMNVISTTENRYAICGNLVNPNEDRGQDAVIVVGALEPIGVNIFYKSPEDSLLTVLRDTTIAFLVRARIAPEDTLHYQWNYGDSLLGTDTSQAIQFINLGDFPVSCRVTAGAFSATAEWMVHVRDLFIASYSPDTLSLSRRRGTSQTFSLDSVAAVAGDPVQYQWTLTNLNNFEREDAGTELRATIDFLQSGNFQLEGLAYRGESSDNVIWTIQIRSAILDFWPRSLNLTVLPDSLVNFGVLPFNPASDSLSYAWYLNNDLIGLDSTMQWRFAPGDHGDSTSYSFSVIVMDGSEGDTVRWTVNVHPPEGVGKWTSGQVDKWGILSVSPNPFNNSTTIRFTVPSSSSSSSAQSASSAVNLSLHDLTGRDVQELINSPLSAGPHAITLNGADLPAGIYLLKLETGSSRKIAKIALVR